MNTTSRRNFVKTTAALGFAASVGGESISVPRLRAAQSSSEPAELANEREKRKWRRRRLIYNNDGCDVMMAGADTLDGFLSHRSRPVLGTQVDSVFYCTGATTMFTHLARVGETYGDFVSDNSEAMAVHCRDNIRALKDKGHDTLAATVQFCHEQNLEVFFTHRINDIHDTFLDWERSRWKREHPEYWLNTVDNAAGAGGANSPRHWWSALDFEKPPVRKYLLAIQRDVCARYDIDGIEIDYFRSPMYFRPNLDFQPATDNQREILTGFQRRLRTIAMEAGTRRGRPILMCTRVPATPDTCRHVGIDIERWLKEGLLDVLTVGGGYIPFTEPLEQMVKLAGRYKVPIYATISASGLRAPYNTVEAWRGAAANMFHAGVDGIVTFNLFPSGPDPRLTEIGSKESLRGLDKLFAIDPRRILEGDLVQGIEQRQALPLSIPADGGSLIAGLPIGDDLAAAERSGMLKSAELRIELSDAEAAGNVRVKLNGNVLQPTVADANKLAFRPLPKYYRLGQNQLDLAAIKSTDAEHLGDLTRVEAHVKYHS